MDTNRLKILALCKSSRGVYISSIKVFSVEAFFSLDAETLPTWGDYYYVLKENSNEEPRLLTKKKLREEFSEFSHSPVFKNLMGRTHRL